LGCSAGNRAFRKVVLKAPNSDRATHQTERVDSGRRLAEARLDCVEMGRPSLVYARHAIALYDDIS